MTETMESKIIELETLTPLFIKGKEEVYGEGFLRIGNTLFLIDNDNLCKYVEESNKTTEYAQYFSNRESDVKCFLAYHAIDLSESEISEYEKNEKKFKKFLNDRNKDLQCFKNYQEYKDRSISFFLNKEGIFPSESTVKNDLAKGITRILSGNTFIQNGNGNYYIPGSSLKGAIRNAVLWKILSDPTKKTWFQSFLNYHLPIADVSIMMDKKKYIDAQNIINQNSFLRGEKLISAHRVNSDRFERIKKKYITEFSEQPDERKKTLGSKSFTEKTPYIPVLDSFEINYKKYLSKYNERWNDVNVTLRDFFRLVKISDANFVNNVSLRVEAAKAVCKEISLNSTENKTYQKSFFTKLECATKTAKAHFKITIDMELAKVFFPNGIPSYLQSVEELLKVVDEFFNKVAKFEKDEFYKGAQSIPVDINPDDKAHAKLKVNTKNVEDLYINIVNTFEFASDNYLFRTGWGCGFMSKTQFLHLDMADRIRVRDMIRYNGSTIAPKSRCLIVEGQNATEPLGWCKLRVLGEAKDLPLPGINVATFIKNFQTEQAQGSQDGQHYPQGSRQNPKRPLSTSEIKKLDSASSVMLKQAIKHTKSTTGKKAQGLVVISDFLNKSLTININNQKVTINYNKMRQIGEQIDVEILEQIDCKITKIKIDNESKNCK